MTVINKYGSSTGASKYRKKILTDMKWEMCRNIRMVRNFTTQLSILIFSLDDLYNQETLGLTLHSLSSEPNRRI